MDFVLHQNTATS